MPESSSKLSRSVTPGKIVLIAVLGVVLVAVLVVQFGGSFFSTQPASSAETSSAAAAARATEPSPQTTQTSATQKRPTEPWPKVALVDVLARDPFAVPAGLVALLPPPPAATAQGDQGSSADELRQQQRELLQGLSVSIILKHNDEFVAVIGNRTVRVGDLIGDFRVVNINLKEGVVLEPADEEP